MGIRDTITKLFTGLDVDACIENFTDEELDLLTQPEPPPVPPQGWETAAGGVTKTKTKKRTTRKTARKGKEVAVPKKRTTRKKKTAKKIALTGKACATVGCAHKLPGKGQEGYSPARKYCSECQVARAQAKADQKAEYLRKKAKREEAKQKRRNEVAAQQAQEAAAVADVAAPAPTAGLLFTPPTLAQDPPTVQTPENLAPKVPKGTKLDAKGLPEFCYVCGGFVPDSVPYAAACSKEHHKLRKSGKRKLSAQDVRRMKNAYDPVGALHPQGTFHGDSKPERKRKGKARNKVESVAVPLQESGDVQQSSNPFANLERILRSSDDPTAKAMLDELLREQAEIQ